MVPHRGPNLPVGLFPLLACSLLYRSEETRNVPGVILVGGSVVSVIALLLIPHLRGQVYLSCRMSPSRRGNGAIPIRHDGN